MSEEELTREWAKALEGGGVKELRRLAARRESLKEAAKKRSVDSGPKSDKLQSD